MKEILGFSNYLACKKGHVYSKDYKRTGKIKRLKPACGPDGYLHTMLKDDTGKYRSLKIHYLVMLAYVGERKEGMSINHIDGNKQNNSPENLEYCTISENMLHAFQNGLIRRKRGALNGMAKLKKQDVIEIKKHIKNHEGRYYGREELAAKYGVTVATIKDISIGRTWKHVIA